MAKIIIPILEEDVNEGKFKELVKIVKNLSDYDYHVKEAIMKNKNNGLIKVGCYNGLINIDKKYDIIDLEKLYGEIKSCIVGGVYSWYNKYEELIRFFDENKMRPNKESKNNDEKTLGIWVVKLYKTI